MDAFIENEYIGPHEMLRRCREAFMDKWREDHKEDGLFGHRGPQELLPGEMPYERYRRRTYKGGPYSQYNWLKELKKYGKSYEFEAVHKELLHGTNGRR